MKKRVFTSDLLQAFEQHLRLEEKSAATIEKYIRDVRYFAEFAGGETVEKETAMAYKNYLVEKGYAVRSINSMLASLNSFFAYQDWPDCKVKAIRQQKQTYCEEEKELTKAEYMRLLKAADRKQQIWLVMQTICGTGIRVSELKCFTLERVRKGRIVVDCKGKNRVIWIPEKLKKLLLGYAKKQGIESGLLFVDKNGKPLSRCKVWAQMKALCKKAGVNPGKVFPHNLRKLFARTFYALEKDIAKLADILGHSSINTTRIYIMSSGTEHRAKIEKLGLVV